jgi:hypothetical protein
MEEFSDYTRRKIKMKKTRIAICALLLLMLLLFASLTATIPAVKAYDENYGYGSNLYTTNWCQYSNNAESTWTAFTQISDLFADTTAYYWNEAYQWWFYYGPAYGEVTNWGSGAVPNNVYAKIDDANSYHSEFSTVLYVGHGGPLGFYLHSNDPNNASNPPTPYATFANIASHTQSSPAHRFAFMWVCMGGENSPQGSPSAWNPLYWSNPSTYGPYTWIGFDGASPWLIDGMGTYGAYGQENIYRYWLVFFYYFALDGSYSVMDALNLASQATGFSNYGSSILGTGAYQTYWPYNDTWGSGRMHVAGDPYGTYLPTELYLY